MIKLAAVLNPVGLKRTNGEQKKGLQINTFESRAQNFRILNSSKFSIPNFEHPELCSVSPKPNTQTSANTKK